MSRIHYDDIHASFCQRCNPLFRIRTGTNRRAHTQTSLLIFTGHGIVFGFLNILNGDHAFKVEVVINYQNFFNAIFVQQL